MNEDKLDKTIEKIELYLESNQQITEKMESMFFEFSKLVHHIFETERLREDRENAKILKEKELEVKKSRLNFKLKIAGGLGILISGLFAIHQFTNNDNFFSQLKTSVRNERLYFFTLTNQLISQLQVAEQNKLFKEELIKCNKEKFVDSVLAIKVLQVPINEFTKKDSITPLLKEKYSIDTVPYILH